MYPYQQQYIYDPVINELLNQKNDKMKMLALATSAGKTHTLTRHVIPDIMKNNLADIVIFLLDCKCAFTVLQMCIYFVINAHLS